MKQNKKRNNNQKLKHNHLSSYKYNTHSEMIMFISLNFCFSALIDSIGDLKVELFDSILYNIFIVFKLDRNFI